MLFGEKLRKLRKLNGLSQENLAVKLNVSRQAVSKWETGVIPDIDNVVKIAKFFDCSLDYLLDENDSNVSKDEAGEETSLKIKESEPDKMRIIKIITAVPVLVILIMWGISKFVNYPITHRDYQSGNYYTGFGGFIDYFRLQGVIYLCVAIWVASIFLQAIWRLYIYPKKEGLAIEKKFLRFYFLRFILIMVGTVYLTNGIFNPWKFNWTIQVSVVLSIYFLVVLFLSVALKEFEDNEQTSKKQ